MVPNRTGSVIRGEPLLRPEEILRPFHVGTSQRQHATRTQILREPDQLRAFKLRPAGTHFNATLHRKNNWD